MEPSVRLTPLGLPRPAGGRSVNPSKRASPPLCPDFVLELRSPTDNFAVLEAKLAEYRDNGARLGWLLDPQTRQVQVYRPHQPPEVLAVETLSGEDVLRGFRLELREVWEI